MTCTIYILAPTVCIDIGETRGDGVWEKRISVETGVGGCDILTVDYMVWI